MCCLNNKIFKLCLTNLIISIKLRFSKHKSIQEAFLTDSVFLQRLWAFLADFEKFVNL